MLVHVEATRHVFLRSVVTPLAPVFRREISVSVITLQIVKQFSEDAKIQFAFLD